MGGFRCEPPGPGGPTAQPGCCWWPLLVIGIIIAVVIITASGG